MMTMMVMTVMKRTAHFISPDLENGHVLIITLQSHPFAALTT
jgi:hypothetical protein